MAQSAGTTGVASSYVTKFGVGLALIVLVVVMAGANVYTGLAPQIAPAVRAELLSGILSILIVFVIALAFLVTTLGRESLSSLTNLTRRAQRMERGDLDVELNTSKNDEVGQLYRSFAAMRDALRTRIREAESQNQDLQTVAADYRDVMGEIADGDLSRRLDEDVDAEVMATLASDFNEMMDQLELTIMDVYDFTEEVSAATEVLSRQTEEAMRASIQINDAAEGMTAAGSGEALQSLNDLDGIAADFGDVSEAGTGAETEMDVEMEAAGAEATAVEIQETLSAINRLSDRMDRVDEITEFISDIATETNMLALNAGIEASKVDSGGAEGFQVVADEVKSLAEETKDSANEIEAITEDIRGGTNDAVGSILKQQAALLSMMNEQATDLSEASEELRLTLQQLKISERPGSGVQVETPTLEGESQRFED